MNHYILLVMDSCRYDSVNSIWNEMSNLQKLGDLKKAYSFATWTLPAFMNFLTGRLPWLELDETESKILKLGGREFYSDMNLWQKRLNIPKKTITSAEYEITSILHSLEYKVKAIVSAKPIGPGTFFEKHVDELHFVGREGATFERCLKHLDFSTPSFYIINICETHYPYFDGSYDSHFSMKIVPGLGGQRRAAEEEKKVEISKFSKEELNTLRCRQISAVKYIDSFFGELYKKVPENTFITVTSDHGECFGEEGQFGHGEANNIKVLEVPFIEGIVPKNR